MVDIRKLYNNLLGDIESGNTRIGNKILCIVFLCLTKLKKEASEDLIWKEIAMNSGGFPQNLWVRSGTSRVLVPRSVAGVSRRRLYDVNDGLMGRLQTSSQRSSVRFSKRASLS